MPLFARVRVRQTERQGSPGTSARHARLVNSGAMHRRMSRRASCAVSGQASKSACRKASRTPVRKPLCVMQVCDSTGNLLTARKCGHFGHGRVAFLQRRLPQGVGQHGGPRPQHNPACFQSAVTLQGMAPIFQQRADMQAEGCVPSGATAQELGNSFSAAFRVIFKDHLKGVPRFGKRGLELFRQAGDDGRVFFHPTCFSEPSR